MDLDPPLPKVVELRKLGPDGFGGGRCLLETVDVALWSFYYLYTPRQQCIDILL